MPSQLPAHSPSFSHSFLHADLNLPLILPHSHTLCFIHPRSLSRDVRAETRIPTFLYKVAHENSSTSLIPPSFEMKLHLVGGGRGHFDGHYFGGIRDASPRAVLEAVCLFFGPFFIDFTLLS